MVPRTSGELMPENLGRLPKEPADLFTRPFLRFVRIESMAGGALLLCAVTALVLANTRWSASYLSFWDVRAGLSLGEIEFSRSLRHWINDALMTLFFSSLHSNSNAKWF
jgi:NhaA family Na+:H+ antiporter